VLGVTLIATVFEILFLYWDALRSVRELSRVAGLDLFADRGVAGEEKAVAAALARAALELPNSTANVFGVDPHRETSKWRLVAVSLAYKAKVGVTNFVAKVLIRRVLTRAALRVYAPFVAIPVTAAWNALVTWMVLREARLRAMGPSAVAELSQSILGKASSLSAAGRLAAIRAVASCIVRTKDMHPNLLRLLVEVHRRCPDPEPGDLDDVPAFLASLPTLADEERRVVVLLLGLAAIVDGRLRRDERRLIRETQIAAGLPVDLRAAERLRRTFVRGEAIQVEQLRASRSQAA
jgi:hypothetical protein